jgi:hypothetical protein
MGGPPLAKDKILWIVNLAGGESSGLNVDNGAVTIFTSQAPIARPGTQAWRAKQAPDQPTTLHVSQGDQGGPEPLDEALVELPHVLLELSHLDHHSPRLAAGANIGIAGLALVRAAQCFQIPGWGAKLEGASAVALAAAGVASALPGGLAHTLGHGAQAGHGLLELGLGSYQAADGLKGQHGWRQVADGALGMVKGAAALMPMFAPGLEHASHLVELGALLGRIGLKATSAA